MTMAASVTHAFVVYWMGSEKRTWQLSHDNSDVVTHVILSSSRCELLLSQNSVVILQTNVQKARHDQHAPQCFYV